MRALIGALAMGECGDEAGCIKNYLYGVKNYHSASGILNFDENGDVIKSITLKTIQNGRFVPYAE
ncbi:MAG: hypothetical protein HY367_00930 [Candidatus Aenigmarchaeota archaeon]|nr:hypothetical protein [Candidatus Aenigmarchaeota archaeon]